MSKKIAITGGIGTGKSTIARYLKQLGYPVFSCDEIYKEITQKEEYLENLRAVFPQAIQNNTLNRAALSKLIFENDKNRELLNSISHPLIMQNLKEKMDCVQSEIVFAEVPLLFESGYEKEFDEIIVVTRSMNARIIAICTRDSISVEEAKKRIQSQYDYDSKEGRANLKALNCWIIENDGSEFELYNKIKNFFR